MNMKVHKGKDKIYLSKQNEEKEYNIKMMNIKKKIHQRSFYKHCPKKNMQNKINQSNGMWGRIGIGRHRMGIKIYYDTLCRINSIPITLYHSP